MTPVLTGTRASIRAPDFWQNPTKTNFTSFRICNWTVDAMRISREQVNAVTDIIQEKMVVNFQNFEKNFDYDILVGPSLCSRHRLLYERITSKM